MPILESTLLPSHRRVLPAAIFLLLALCFRLPAAGNPEPGRIFGKVLDPQGAVVAAAQIKLADFTGAVIREAKSDAQGNFSIDGVAAGRYQLRAEFEAFAAVSFEISMVQGQQREVNVEFLEVASVRQAFTVVASAPSLLTPDPSETVVIHDQVLDANPGRPGAPISIPGLPIETASGGIKAPQYFAPGVAGDHGEPIGQFFQVGNFLFPNNLPANAHGNGYADPNFLIAPVIEGVTVEGGAFNVREGNHSVDLAATYVPRGGFRDFVQVTGDYRDFDVMAGWSPATSSGSGWIAGEASVGNGFLERLEHRQQYKLNGMRVYKVGKHEVTLFGIGYYGYSYVPGLIPVHVAVAGDTIDNRQSDTTHNILLAASDTWRIGEQGQFVFAGFFRNYALELRSNFGDGLIQQSELRNVYGGNATYLQRLRRWISLLAGVDLRRDAPHGLDLKRIDSTGIFEPVTSNNLTLSFAEPFVSLDGNASKYIHYDVGVRQEAVWVDNQDVLNPGSSFNRLATLTLPKVTLTILPPERAYLPTVAFSYGEAFHTEDPRIGNGTAQPPLVASSRAYQLRVSKLLKQTQVDLTLRRTANSQELAKIDPDTGLQLNFGPSVNRVVSVSVQRNFAHGAIYVSYAQADARDTQTGMPVPEAPRTIWDAVGSENHLPFHLQARGEFEFVKAKPLGDGFVGVPVVEVRGALLRPFLENRMSVGANFLIASGYTGQTTETIATLAGPCAVECVVGVPLKSYASLSWTYYFKK